MLSENAVAPSRCRRTHVRTITTLKYTTRATIHRKVEVEGSRKVVEPDSRRVDILARNPIHVGATQPVAALANGAIRVPKRVQHRLQLARKISLQLSRHTRRLQEPLLDRYLNRLSILVRKLSYSIPPFPHRRLNQPLIGTSSISLHLLAARPQRISKRHAQLRRQRLLRLRNSNHYLRRLPRARRTS